MAFLDELLDDVETVKSDEEYAKLVKKLSDAAEEIRGEPTDEWTMPEKRIVLAAELHSDGTELLDVLSSAIEMTPHEVNTYLEEIFPQE